MNIEHLYPNQILTLGNGFCTLKHFGYNILRLKINKVVLTVIIYLCGFIFELRYEYSAVFRTPRDEVRVAVANVFTFPYP